MGRACAGGGGKEEHQGKSCGCVCKHSQSAGRAFGEEGVRIGQRVCVSLSSAVLTSAAAALHSTRVTRRKCSFLITCRGY